MTSQINSILFSQPFQFLVTPPLRNDSRLWKRRRLKRPKRLLLRNGLLPPLSSSPSEVLSLLSSNWIPPAVLGFASGVLLSLSSRRPGPDDCSGSGDSGTVGEWVLFTSPTPFNRFVFLRCATIGFEGENVGYKLVSEERHYVRVDSGRISRLDRGIEDIEGGVDEEVEYERECVGMEDGGVISLDWPKHLELREERGLDTTVLIVPGTTEGSMEESVREFVKECLRRGLFPVVMNPRGCASSPVTTARLFTAADSDDISAAIQFIARARPWSTLTGVGWGYGANMLAKYLAEAGEKTPLTAATCINNPFDLDEATRTSPYNTTMDKKVTGGLIDILKSNKEIFQGRRKGFDVEKALAAESIRDFDTAISIVSHGFESVEDFYANCSTRSMIGDVKIPVLFIQNDDGSVPLFSVPRAPIAENPFTSLLLCSCVPYDVTAISWCQQVTIEWLAAVELGLLKGRHPRLQDIDVTINPSKSLALKEGRSFHTDSSLQRLFNLAAVNGTNPNVDPVKKMLTESAPDGVVAVSGVDLHSDPISRRNQGSADYFSTELNSISANSHSVDAASAENTGATPAESDTGQVLLTTQVVMNMLDVTMPGTLKEEEKRKVVQAVSQGETLIKALQDAVPEDVRGKLTSSVSEILQAQGTNLNLDGLLSINQIANISSGFKSERKEKLNKQSSMNHERNEHPSDEKDGENNGRSKGSSSRSDDVNVIGGESSGDIIASNSGSSYSDALGIEKGSIDAQNSDDKHNGEVSQEKVGQLSEFGDDETEANSQIIADTKALDVGDTQKNDSQDDNSKEQDSKDMPTSVESSKGELQEQDMSSATVLGPDDSIEAASSVPKGQLSEKSDDDTKSKDEKTLQPDQNRASDAKSPSFNVTQALDTLTGLDDSTQVAVNSVFGVIEDIITQLEEKKNETDQKHMNNNDALTGSVLEKNRVTSDLQLEKQTDGEDQEDATVSVIESVNGHVGDNNVEAVAEANKRTNISKLPSITADPLSKAVYEEYLQIYVISKLHNVKSLKLDATAGLYLHYAPEEGHWILLENPKGMHDSLATGSKDKMDSDKLLRNEDDIIEPSYVILDKDGQGDTIDELESKETLYNRAVNPDNKLGNSISSVRTILFDSLKVEVSRRLSVTDMKDMEAHLVADMEKVAEAVSLAIENDEKSQHASISGVDNDVLESGWLDKDHVVEAISKAVQDTAYLKTVVPVGVVVGSSLAALRNCCDGTAVVDNGPSRMLNLNKGHSQLTEHKDRVQQKDDILVPVEEKSSEPVIEKNLRKEEESITLTSLNGVHGNKAQSDLMSTDTLMVGAVTAALGASAFLTTHQEDIMESASYEASSDFEERHMNDGSRKLEEARDNKHHSNIVTSLAEKAMSVAAPVVPKKEDGGVDHERLVATLTELGQRGGMLRLVAKLALLWGGLRGAISLTDRLLSFLRVAERPLILRILGFFCMVLVLWSPVLVPLLPTLFHNMATHSSSRIAELACIIGLYAAVTILITQWGKIVRGYEYPLKQYGLDFMSSKKIQDFLSGLAGGVVLVLSIHFVNTLLGFVSFSLPTNLSSSSLDFMSKLKAYGQLVLLAARGLFMAAGVTLVEELLFRSWLLEEVAADLGYQPAIILSGLAFSLTQRSMLAIPGLWLWSLCLAGVRLRKEGSLFIPIGLRTGVMSSSFILQMGGFMICQPRTQLWVAGMHPLQPFTGVVGILAALLFAVILYPSRPGLSGKVPRPIRALRKQL